MPLPQTARAVVVVELGPVDVVVVVVWVVDVVPGAVVEVVVVVVTGEGSPPHAPGPPVTPMSFCAPPCDGGKQTSSYCAAGFPVSMAGEPTAIFRSSAVQPVPASTGFTLTLPVPVKPPSTSEYVTV